MLYGTAAAAPQSTTHVLPDVVIVGGGFGGIAAARGLAGVDCRITLVDRRNYHLFQPLLY
jgi:NADH dehydrogenase/putative oxidoreductase